MTLQRPSSSFDTSSEAQSRRRGRLRGNRALLADKFFSALHASWEEQGDSALARAAFHDPVAFVGIVARLMPQKIEHSTPTDGMTDERLSQLLDLAEGMIALRLNGSTAHQLTHENRTIDVTPEEGGGGPGAAVDAAGGGSTSTSRGVFEGETPQEPLNKVNETPVSPESPYDDRTPVTPFSSSNDIPHPVGRPFAKLDHDVERQNKSGLAAADDIDPASLF